MLDDLRRNILEIMVRTHQPERFQVVETFKHTLRQQLGDYLIAAPDGDKLFGVPVEYVSTLGATNVLALRNQTNMPFHGISQDEHGQYWLEHWYATP